MTEAPPPPVDCRGRRVHIGSRLRVLKISAWLEREIPADEFARLQSLVGQVLPISEIDEWGRAWIWAEFPHSPGHIHTHDLALDPDEMELVEDEGPAVYGNTP